MEGLCYGLLFVLQNLWAVRRRRRRRRRRWVVVVVVVVVAAALQCAGIDGVRCVLRSAPFSLLAAAVAVLSSPTSAPA